MKKPSIVKFTTPPPVRDGNIDDVLSRVELLKKDLSYILGALEEKIENLKK